MHFFNCGGLNIAIWQLSMISIDRAFIHVYVSKISHFLLQKWIFGDFLNQNEVKNMRAFWKLIEITPKRGFLDQSYGFWNEREMNCEQNKTICKQIHSLVFIIWLFEKQILNGEIGTPQILNFQTKSNKSNDLTIVFLCFWMTGW